jgi:uncharacterized protein
MQAIRNDFESSRFIAYVDGQVAGSLQYRIQDGQMQLLDVDVDPAYRRLQLPSRLIRQALVEAGRRRLSVVPFCHEARSQVLSHPVFLQLVPSEHRQRLHESARASKRTRRGEGAPKNRHLASARPKEGEAA